MCGICGVYALHASAPEKKVFKGLLLLNVWRGEHSTGVVHMEQKGNNFKYRAQRAVVPSPTYLYSDQGKAFIDENSKGGRTLGYIGHTRAATKGSITPKNAHPFNFPNVIGVHNGTIHKKFEGSDAFETDSEALYSLINEVGLKEALDEVSDYNTAYALAFIDKKAGTLNFIRNAKRPLHFTYTYSQGTIVWSSTKEMLEMAVGRMNVANTGWKGSTKDKVFTLNENDLLSIEIGKSPGTATLTHLDVKKPSTTSYTTGGSVTVYPTGGHYGGMGGDEYGEVFDELFKPKDEIVGVKTFWCSDGQHRTAEERAAWLRDKDKRRSAAEAVFKPKVKDQGEYEGHRQHHSTDGLRALAWLRDEDSTSQLDNTEAANDKATDGKKHEMVKLYGTEPMTRHELAYKLSLGCMCCGTVVDPADTKEVDRTKWWSRDHYACGDCYEHSDGDWVRCSIDDDWGEDTKSVSIH